MARRGSISAGSFNCQAVSEKRYPSNTLAYPEVAVEITECLDLLGLQVERHAVKVLLQSGFAVRLGNN